MCFSPTADVVAAAVIGAAGVDAVRHVGGRDEALLATLPLLLAGHTLVEAFVWWGLRGQVGDGVEAVAVAVYLGFAFVVLPVYAPASVMALERGPVRRRVATMVHGRVATMVVTVALAAGVVTAVALAAALLRGPVTVRAERHHVVYNVELWAGPVVVGLYLFATCGAFLVASRRFLHWFGAVNLAAVALLAWIATHAVISLWCAWAAVVSIAIALHLRHRRRPSVSWSSTPDSRRRLSP